MPASQSWPLNLFSFRSLTALYPESVCLVIPTPCWLLKSLSITLGSWAQKGLDSNHSSQSSTTVWLWATQTLYPSLNSDSQQVHPCWVGWSWGRWELLSVWSPVGTQQLLDRCSHLLYNSGYLFSTIKVVLTKRPRKGRHKEAQDSFPKRVLRDSQVLKLQQHWQGVRYAHIWGSMDEMELGEGSLVNKYLLNVVIHILWFALII